MGADTIRLLSLPSRSLNIGGDDRNTATIHYHRALALLALGKEKAAEEDLAIVRKLIGGEPDERLF